MQSHYLSYFIILFISELNYSRLLHSCGLLTQYNSVTGVRERVVVVTGGSTKDHGMSSSTELLFVDSNLEWIKGPELPRKNDRGTMVEFDRSVILIGGRGDKNLYQLSSAHGDWKIMPQSLSEAYRPWPVSFLIPDTLANCSEKTN